MNDRILIDQMCSKDWEQVRKIYLEGLSSGNANFPEEMPSWEVWDKSHLSACRIVARYQDKVLGWAALSSISARPVYAGVAEVSVYVSQSSQGKGIGSSLLKNLIEMSEQNGFWTLLSRLFPENIPSLKLHHKFGFREVGRLDRIGQMNGKWRDVILLERRSHKVGN